MIKHLLIAYGVYWMYCKKVEQNQTVATFPRQTKNIGNAMGGDLKKRVFQGGQTESIR